MPEDVIDIRNRMVTKSNALIQRSRFNLSLLQQKIILYLISQITPYDEEFKTYEFSIVEFCKVCGIDYDSGGNYSNLKTAIKEIRDKSLWVKVGSSDILLAWIEKARIDENSGIIQIRLDEDMKPYLLQLKQNFTSYELIYTLHFKSKYTIRLYELIKSIHFHELEEYKRSFTVDELRRLLDAENYALYKNFKSRVLLPAVREINQYSDKDLSFLEVKKGRSVSSIEFTIRTKDVVERLQIRAEIERDLGPEQLTIWDQIVDAAGGREPDDGA